MIYGALHLAARHPARHRQSFPIRWYEKRGLSAPVLIPMYAERLPVAGFLYFSTTNYLYRLSGDAYLKQVLPVSIVITARQNIDIVLIDSVDQAVFIIDPSAPISR